MNTYSCIIPYLLSNIKFSDDTRGSVVLLDSELDDTSAPSTSAPSTSATRENEASVPSTSVSSTKSHVAKYMIEQRYNRLNKNLRRPSLEYISSEDILTIFLNFVDDKEILYKMSKIDLQNLYDKWYSEVYLATTRSGSPTSSDASTSRDSPLHSSYV